MLAMDKNSTLSDKKIRVRAPARLHLGFLDLNPNSDRQFGSIGLAIDSYHTTIEAKLAPTTLIEVKVNEHSQDNSITKKVEDIIQLFYTKLGSHIPEHNRGLQLVITSLIPQHAGLGSGTQLALTLGTILCHLHDINADKDEIALHLGRGRRSGIGIAIFEHGGFVIDGGLSNTATTPPLLTHHDFPSSWRIVLILDNNTQGVHGNEEVVAFSELPMFPLSKSQTICHLTLMTLLPALVEQEINAFGQAITEIQSIIGAHFSPAQGGRYSSPKVAALLHQAQKSGHFGLAQSSWGPTGCVFVKNESDAQGLISTLKQHSTSDISFSIVQANSNGAHIDVC